MPDYFCSKLRSDAENLECPVYCGIEGTGFPCMQDDHSPCGEYYNKPIEENKTTHEATEYIADY